MDKKSFTTLQGKNSPLLDLTQFKNGHLIREIIGMYLELNSQQQRASVVAKIEEVNLGA